VAVNSIFLYIGDIKAFLFLLNIKKCVRLISFTVGGSQLSVCLVWRRQFILIELSFRKLILVKSKFVVN